MESSRRRQRPARELHPVAWWAWAAGAAAAASMTTNPLVLAVLVAVICLVVAACRGDGTWARAFRLYVWIAVATVVIRVVFRILLAGDGTGRVLVDLPSVELPDWAAGIHLLGPVTVETLRAGFADGVQLATILLAFGAANALANPKRLLKNLPPALYEIGTALVVAVSVLPQLVDSARRVKHAQELRGGPSGRFRGLRRILVPVLEDAFERSLALAAGMDARGYGRRGTATPAERRRTGALMLAAVMGTCVGVYAFLDPTAPAWLGVPMLLLGTGLAVLGLRSAGARVRRTRYRPEAWQVEELLVVVSAAIAVVGLWWVSRTELLVAHPGVVDAPSISVLALCAPLVALLPVVVAPPAPRVTTRDTGPIASRPSPRIDTTEEVTS